MTFIGVIPSLRIFNNHFYTIFAILPDICIKISLGFLYALCIASLIHFVGRHLFLAIIYSFVTLIILKSIHAITFHSNALMTFFGIENKQELFDLIYVLTNVYSVEFISFVFFFFIIFISLKKYCNYL